MWTTKEELGDAKKLIKDFHTQAKKEGRTNESLFLLREATEGGYKIPGDPSTNT